MSEPRPLSAEERELAITEAQRRGGASAALHWEATVRAVEAERDAALARVERLRDVMDRHVADGCSCQTCFELGRALAADDGGPDQVDPGT